MDRWKRKELKQMELGGNKNAAIFYEENMMFKEGRPDTRANKLLPIRKASTSRDVSASPGTGADSAETDKANC